MRVGIVSLTQPCIVGVDNAEQLIAYAARVSNPENQYNTDTAPRLLEYLIRHKHWSPFEMVDVTFFIETSRVVAQQILRHRSFSFQEFSQRYANAHSIEPLELRMSGARNRQSSVHPCEDEQLQKLADASMTASWQCYQELLSNGIARETARMVLPLNTTTHMYMKGSVRSWIHYLQLRCAEDTQKEHREVALAIRALMIDKFPSLATVF
tara:strand:- start:14 stop:643 length:630 start_codon:yes stop_codon:yes gene_type:complete